MKHCSRKRRRKKKILKKILTTTNVIVMKDDIVMEEDTQDVPESSVVTVQDGDLDVDITEVPTTSNATVFDLAALDVKPKEETQPLVEQSSISSGLVKGSITAGTPFRPPSVSIIEQPPSVSQLPANASQTAVTSQPSGSEFFAASPDSFKT
ncbi:hypothetical protein COOONC_28713 [Cooperia oncophora]